MNRIETGSSRLVPFLLDEQRYGIELSHVEIALPMVELARFPRAPAIVRGVFVLQGEPVPAIEVRSRFQLPSRPLSRHDRLLVVRTARRRLALIVDGVEPVVQVPNSAVTLPQTVVPGLTYLRGVTRLPELGIVFVHDLDALLSLDEESDLDLALEETTP